MNGFRMHCNLLRGCRNVLSKVIIILIDAWYLCPFLSGMRGKLYWPRWVTLRKSCKKLQEITCGVHIAILLVTRGTNADINLFKCRTGELNLILFIYRSIWWKSVYQASMNQNDVALCSRVIKGQCFDNSPKICWMGRQINCFKIKQKYKKLITESRDKKTIGKSQLNCCIF